MKNQNTSTPPSISNNLAQQLMKTMEEINKQVNQERKDRKEEKTKFLNEICELKNEIETLKSEIQSQKKKYEEKIDNDGKKYNKLEGEHKTEQELNKKLIGKKIIIN